MVFCKSAFRNERKYIELKITMNVQVRGKSSLFVGLVDRSKYRQEQLTSTYWKDSPSSFYWDVWNNKLIRIDDNGVQTGVAIGYGCSCQDTDVTVIGILYDPKSKTISYYKDGANQGVAFHDVPLGLYPALDLWFDSGNIEILNKTHPTLKEYL